MTESLPHNPGIASNVINKIKLSINIMTIQNYEKKVYIGKDWLSF